MEPTGIGYALYVKISLCESRSYFGAAYYIALCSKAMKKIKTKKKTLSKIFISYPSRGAALTISYRIFHADIYCCVAKLNICQNFKKYLYVFGFSIALKKNRVIII